MEGGVLPVGGTAGGDEVLELVDGLALKCCQHACRIDRLRALDIVTIQTVDRNIAAVCCAVGHREVGHIGAVEQACGVLGCGDPAAVLATAAIAEVYVIGGVASETCGCERALAAREVVEVRADVGRRIQVDVVSDYQVVGQCRCVGVGPANGHAPSGHIADCEVGGGRTHLNPHIDCPRLGDGGVLRVDDVGHRCGEVVGCGSAYLRHSVDRCRGAGAVEREGGDHVVDVGAEVHLDIYGARGAVDDCGAFLCGRRGDGEACHLSHAVEGGDCRAVGVGTVAIGADRADIEAVGGVDVESGECVAIAVDYYGADAGQ